MLLMLCWRVDEERGKVKEYVFFFFLSTPLIFAEPNMPHTRDAFDGPVVSDLAHHHFFDHFEREKKPLQFGRRAHRQILLEIFILLPRV